MVGTQLVYDDRRPVQASSQAGTKIKIETHGQMQSPLFRLPGEIRNRINQLALRPYDDTSKPFRQDSYYYRPEHTCPQRVDLALLQTCRRMYHEAACVGERSKLLTLWYEWEDRRPPGHAPEDDAGLDVAQYWGVHVFAQMYWLENFGLNDLFDPDRQRSSFETEVLWITIRHTDWWNWEANAPLRIDNRWIECFVPPTSLREFRLELEVPKRKQNELDTTVNRLVRDWKISIYDTTFSTQSVEPVVSSWTGSAVFDGINYEPEIERKDSEGKVTGMYQPETIEYHVVTVRWLPMRKVGS